MGYSESLKAAGATVLFHETAGDYQGRWVAVVEIGGERKAVIAYYGSCSGCDAFQAEFDYDQHSYDTHDGEDTYFSARDVGSWKDDCAECQALKVKLAAFGKKYLDEAVTIEAALKELDQSGEEWPSEDKGALHAALVKFLGL